MKAVSRFEANLLRVLQSFLGQAPQQQALSLVMRQTSRPPCLSRAAVELIQDRLSKGTVLFLARSGWRRERFLRDGQVVTGRLWERTPPEQLGLTFSKHSLGFLLWIMMAGAKDNRPAFHPHEHELTVGDRLLFLLALHCLRGFDSAKVLCRHSCFRRDGLIRLAFPDLVQDTQAAIDWSLWKSGVGACIWEAMQGLLAERWIETEREKEKTAAPKELMTTGQNQETVLGSLTNALTTTGRWDLARFLLRALAALLQDAPPARRWLGIINMDALRLAERQGLQRSALAFVRHLETLRQWEGLARTIGYFDEGYAAAQLWKADWEAWDGEQLHRQAQALLREIEPVQ